MNCSRTLGLRTVFYLVCFFKIKWNLALSFHWGELEVWCQFWLLPFPTHPVRRAQSPPWSPTMAHGGTPILLLPDRAAPPAGPSPHRRRCSSTEGTKRSPLPKSCLLLSPSGSGILASTTCRIPQIQAEVLSTEGYGFDNSKQKALTVLLVG